VISFIVPAHNEARLLGATLAALHAAARALDDPYEVIVVDDASTDATGEIARQQGARVLAVEHRHIAAARNAGARHAHGEVFVFVDADTLIDDAVLRAAVAAIRSGAVGGGGAVQLEGRQSWHVRWSMALLMCVFRVTRIAPGCFVFCTRKAFEAVDGFNEVYFAAEDIAISRALSRHGRFVILRQPVMTSARKLRTFSAAEHLRLLLRFTLLGRAMLKSRRHLHLWYGDRRDDLR